MAGPRVHRGVNHRPVHRLAAAQAQTMPSLPRNETQIAAVHNVVCRYV
jgi:hypothetical protein